MVRVTDLKSERAVVNNDSELNEANGDSSSAIIPLGHSTEEDQVLKAESESGVSQMEDGELIEANGNRSSTIPYRRRRMCHKFRSPWFSVDH